YLCLLVLQLQLTYRYITVMMEEVASILRAYAMRAPRQKGVHHSVWGSLSGQLILRTYGRAERVYDAMCLRGFNGEYNTGSRMRLTMQDILYCLIWCSFFYAAWRFNLPMLLGSLFTGGF
ncbi:MAG: energy-coupling factor transporter transmembrane component T, partial [Bacillota bacterium]|nr:energy-coupling factor transporter transmembrane component T [Bacillota bacterium]